MKQRLAKLDDATASVWISANHQRSQRGIVGKAIRQTTHSVVSDVIICKKTGLMRTGDEQKSAKQSKCL